MSRARTSQEAMDNLIGGIRVYVDYWSGPNIKEDMPCRERLAGLAHSILCLLDGVTDTLPSVELLLRPHPEDKQFHIDEGNDWWEDGTPIEADSGGYLHDQLYKGWKAWE